MKMVVDSGEGRGRRCPDSIFSFLFHFCSSVRWNAFVGLVVIV